MKHARRWWVAGATLVILVAVAWWARSWIRIDRCLDSGGRWDHQREECEWSDTATSYRMPTVHGRPLQLTMRDLPFALRLSADAPSGRFTH